MNITYNLLVGLPESFRDIRIYLETRGLLTIDLGQDESSYKGLIDRLLVESEVDACLLAPMPGKPDPFYLIKEVQRHTKHLPIVFIADKPEDVLSAYALGVDYCTARPIDPEIFSCYLAALLRRIRAPRLQVTGTYRLGTTVFSTKERKLINAYEITRLSSQETEVLRILCARRNTYVPRDFILEEVWKGVNYYNARVLDVHISRLRKYLKEEPTISILRSPKLGIILQDTEEDALKTAQTF